MTDRGQRLLALDVFRGLTVAAMILVNNPGTWGAIYPPLRHAEWHGWTPTDLIFPFFLFIVGVAIPFAILRRREQGVPLAPVAGKVIRRMFVLVALGLFLSAFTKLFPRGVLNELFGIGSGDLDAAFASWRFPGVLQRIGVCYGVVSLALLLVPRVSSRWVVGVLLLGYWALLTLADVPGGGAQNIDTRGASIVGWLDREVFGVGHLWIKAPPELAFDPEGILSTVPALATTLLGVQVGRMLRGEGGMEGKVATLLRNGALLAILGTVWGWVFPINKPLWTSSYVLLTAGLAMSGLGLCLWACDVRGASGERGPWWSRPFRIYGTHAITVFVGSGVLARLLAWIEWETDDGASVSLRSWLWQRGFVRWHERLVDGLELSDDHWLAAMEVPSLAWALTWILGWGAALWLFDRRGWRWSV